NPPSAGGALVSLQALVTTFNGVDLTGVTGRFGGLPLMQFKSREATWQFGRAKTIPEADSTWAINPLAIAWGCICWNANNEVIGERMVPISQPAIDPATLPDKGFVWQQQWSINVKCLSGADAGVEASYKTTTTGGSQAVCDVITAIRDRLNDSQHGGKVVPI